MKIHFVGIGGTGISALAQYHLTKGNEISGSDLVESEILQLLKQQGARIVIGNLAENIKQDFDLVVYSPAVKKDNPELVEARKNKIKTQSYPEALGELTKEYFTIAVAGAHGKSTTTSMIGLMMTKAKLDPTVVVGTKLKEFGNSNFRSGKSKFLVIEACEYDASFLQYNPNIVVVTNVDKEHLDYFKTFANVKKTFRDFIVRLPKDGFLVFNKDNKFIPKFAKQKFKTFGYSLKQKDSAKIKKVLKVPGVHNVSNALAVLQVGKILGIPENIILKSLGEFKGTWRRFEIIKAKAGTKNITLVSDYGHHPNEILATLNAAREKYPNKKIWCVFQPHQHQRTFYLFKDFVQVFRNVPIDNIIVTDIYDVAGRETKKISEEVSSEKLVKKIGKKNVSYVAFEKVESFVKENIKTGDVLIIMGAGNVYDLVAKF